MTVPKCKECEHHIHNMYIRGSHYCTYLAINKDDVKEWKRTAGRDMHTSPQRCPKRKRRV